MKPLKDASCLNHVQCGLSCKNDVGRCNNDVDSRKKQFFLQNNRSINDCFEKKGQEPRFFLLQPLLCNITIIFTKAKYKLFIVLYCIQPNVNAGISYRAMLQYHYVVRNYTPQLQVRTLSHNFLLLGSLLLLEINRYLVHWFLLQHIATSRHVCLMYQSDCSFSMF